MEGKFPPSNSTMVDIATDITPSETGGATSKGPKSWAPGLEDVFYPKNTTNTTITRTPTPTPAPKPSGKTSKSTIIGGSVGGTIAFLVIAFAAVQIYKIRRAAYNRVRLGGLPPAELEPSTKMPLSAFQELLGSLGKNRNARAAMELPGSLPNHVPARDSNGNPFELPGMGEYDISLLPNSILPVYGALTYHRNNRHDASQPEMSQPEMSQPEMSQPEMSQADVSQTDVSHTDVSQTVGIAVTEDEPVDRESAGSGDPISNANPDANVNSPGSNRHSTSSAQAQEKINMNWI